MSDFNAKTHQMWFPLGLSPRSHWGSLPCSTTPSCLLLRGEKRKGAREESGDKKEGGKGGMERPVKSVKPGPERLLVRPCCTVCTPRCVSFPDRTVRKFIIDNVSDVTPEWWWKWWWWVSKVSLKWHATTTRHKTLADHCSVRVSARNFQNCADDTRLHPWPIPAYFRWVPVVSDATRSLAASFRSLWAWTWSCHAIATHSSYASWHSFRVSASQNDPGHTVILRLEGNGPQSGSFGFIATIINQYCNGSQSLNSCLKFVRGVTTCVWGIFKNLKWSVTQTLLNLI